MTQLEKFIREHGNSVNFKCEFIAEIATFHVSIRDKSIPALYYGNGKTLLGAIRSLEAQLKDPPDDKELFENARIIQLAAAQMRGM